MKSKLIYSVDMIISKSKEHKLTEPQQRIINKLERGQRLRVINTHHSNGGEIVWVTKYDDNIPAGHIYKALQHLLRKLNIEEHTGLFVLQINAV